MATTEIDWADPTAGLDFEDQLWLVKLHLPLSGRVVQRTVGRAYLKHKNLVELMVASGFTAEDDLYYVRQDGIGLTGWSLLESDDTVKEVMELYKATRCINLHVLKSCAFPESPSNK